MPASARRWRRALAGRASWSSGGKDGSRLGGVDHHRAGGQGAGPAHPLRRHLPRHRRAAAVRAAAAPGAEDAERRHAGRRRGPRVQQPAGRHRRLRRPALRENRCRRPVARVPGTSWSCPTGPAADPPAAGLRPQADAAAVSRRRWTSCSAQTAELVQNTLRVAVQLDIERRRRPLRGRGRRQPAAAGPGQPRPERPRRHAAARRDRSPFACRTQRLAGAARPRFPAERAAGRLRGARGGGHRLAA